MPKQQPVEKNIDVIIYKIDDLRDSNKRIEGKLDQMNIRLTELEIWRPQIAARVEATEARLQTRRNDDGSDGTINGRLVTIAASAIGALATILGLLSYILQNTGGKQ